MNFSEALDILKKGGKVSRNGWNGKGMYVDCCILMDFNKVQVNNPCLRLWNTKNNYFNTWIPSITDIFAEDWKEEKR